MDKIGENILILQFFPKWFIFICGKSVSTATDNSGGIQGGISNGQDICFSASFKPPSSISVPQKTITKDNQYTKISITGRHDPCVVPRAVPIVQSLSAIVILDNFLMNKTTKISDLWIKSNYIGKLLLEC